MFKKLVAFVVMMSAALAFAAVDVNKATPAELDGVKGIGPGTAGKIVEERKKGDFKDWADLEARVKGIKDKRAAKLSEAGLTVGGASFAGAPAAAAPAADAKKSKKAEKAEKAAAAASAPAAAPAAAAPAAPAASAAKK